MKNRVLLAIFISLVSLFVYRVWAYPVEIPVLIFLLSVSLAVGERKKNTVVWILILLLLVTLSVITLKQDFDRDLFMKSTNDKDLIAARHEYFSKDLGKIYRNRFGLLYFNEVRTLAVGFNKNLFASLNLNLYFNTSEPLTLFLMPFVLIGLLIVINRAGKLTAGYFFLFLIIAGLLKAGSNYGSIFLLPFVNLGCTLGLLKTIGVVKKC